MSLKKLIVIVVLIIIGLCIWEVIPPRKSTMIYEFDRGINAQLPSDDCINLDEFLSRKWQISYPISIPKKSKSYISAILINETTIIDKHKINNSDCKIAVETLLQYSENNKKVDKSIISPYQTDYPLKLEWKIAGREEDLVGKIWIFLLIENYDGQYSRFPLFVIPIDIKVSSVLGITPRYFRIISTGITILGVLIYTIYKKMEMI
jgi:hypothetical protein